MSQDEYREAGYREDDGSEGLTVMSSAPGEVDEPPGAGDDAGP